MSTEGRIDQSNQAFYDLFGYQYDEEFNWPLTRLVTPQYQEALATTLQTALNRRKSQRFEATAIRKDGTLFEADMVISPVFKRSHNEGSWGLVCSLRDISQRKQVERELRAALVRERELHELKTRFVSTASHEFRTPLATIMATMNLLRNYGDRMDEPKKMQQFEKIDNQINHMTHLMDGVLTLGRMDAGKQPVSLEAVALDMFIVELIEEFQANTNEHQVVYSCSGAVQVAQADRKLMREIIFNLLVNAAKYSEPGSSIYLDLRFQPDHIEISIRDEGIGIPESDQKHLFEAFHRAENVGTIPGTGLGLAIVKNAVDAHRGTIRFESHVNQGTTFTIVFPIH
jgi:PAS domain S-box-containing protein